MTPKAFRTLALSFDGATEAPHFDRAAFRTTRRIFATLTADGAEAMVRVAPQDRVEALLKAYPKVFFSYGKWTEQGALGVHLAQAPDGLLRELVADAFKDALPPPKKPARPGRKQRPR